MSSDAQIRANKANARNATKGGLFSADVVVPALGESVKVFDRFRRRVVRDLAPTGAVARTLANHAAGILWRLRRVSRYEATAPSVAPRGLPIHPDELDCRGVDPFVPLPPQASLATRLAHLRNRYSGELQVLRAVRLAETLVLRLAEAPVEEMVGGNVLELVWGVAEVRFGWRNRPDLVALWQAVLAPLGLTRSISRQDTWTVGQLRAALTAAATTAGHTLQSILAVLSAGLTDARTTHEAQFAPVEEQERTLVEQMLQEREAAIMARAFAEGGEVENAARAESHLLRKLERILAILGGLTSRRRGNGGLARRITELRVGLPAATGSGNGFVLQNGGRRANRAVGKVSEEGVSDSDAEPRPRGER